MRITVRASRTARAPTSRIATPTWHLAAVSALLLLTGCATVEYEPDPLDPIEILRELRATGSGWPLSDEHGSESAETGLSMEQAAALAVTRNPELRAMRARIGVASARLVEAGLLPDPSLGWDGMDALASQWVEGDTERVDFVAGFGLSWSVPRPGEIPALEAIAQAELEQTEWVVTRAEWTLAKDVAREWIDLASVGERLEVANELLTLGRNTAAVLDRARAARAATGIEANLAAIDLAELELQRLRLEDEEIEARQRLNALLGLAPDAIFPLAPANWISDQSFPEPPDAAAIVDIAVAQRPDLAELMEQYRAAEAELALEVARQFPELTIGTGIEITLPLLSRWNRPAIDRAHAEREVIRRAVSAEVARLRAEVHGAVAAYRKARRQADYLVANVEPRLEESIRLTEISLAARELSTLELLLTQRQILNTRMNILNARSEAASRWVQIRAVSGQLFGTGVRRQPNTPDDEDLTR